MTQWITVCKIAEISENQGTSFTTQDGPVAVFCVQGDYYAIEDYCSHQGLPLADGLIDEKSITCPFHGAQFCYRTGQALCAPAMGDIKKYETRVTGDELQIELV